MSSTTRPQLTELEQEFDRKTIMLFRAVAIEVVRRIDRLLGLPPTIPEKHELKQFRKWYNENRRIDIV